MSTNQPHLSGALPRAAAIAFLIAADLIAVLVSFLAAVAVRQAANGDIDVLAYVQLSPVLLLFPVVYVLFQSYPGSTLGPLREVRHLTFATTTVFVMIGAIIFMLKISVYYSRLAFVLAWIFALVVVPAARLYARSLLGSRGWTHPVLIYGSAASAAPLIRMLREKPELGFAPAAVVDIDRAGSDLIEGLPVLHDHDAVAQAAAQLPVTRAVVCREVLNDPAVRELLEIQGSAFTHLYVMAGFDGMSSLGVEPCELGNSLALEIRRNLLMPRARLTKRALDLLIAGATMLLAAPLMAAAVIGIKLTSPGPVFFSQRRLGRGGREFAMWKFRTMRTDAARVLEQLLANDPAARAEWARDHKLSNDPRVTRLGRFLRKTSIDELPQLWNVLRGDMSLVGPRPIVRDEIAKYGEFYRSYSRVLPGLTGLWQVSGRSGTTYQRRIELDAYYVRNWSPLIDIALLFRTVRVVLRAEGAY